MRTPTDLRAAGLLERAVGYTRTSLALVTDPLLDRPTPCSEWDLRTLLEHLDDGLAAFTEAAAAGRVAARATSAPDHGLDADALVARLRQRACDVLAGWAAEPARPGALIGGDSAAPAYLEGTTLAGTGGLEIAVHGWDVAQACGVDRPLPEPLAGDLLPLARALVGDADRPTRFGPAREAPDDTASGRLLALLGR